MPWADDPRWAYGGGLYHVKADYRLMIDNLMDLTHEKYVHQGSIGQAELDEVPAVTALVDGVVTTSRDMQGVQAPPFWRDNLRAAGLPADAPVDRWQRCRYLPPSCVFIDVGVALAGAGGAQAPADQRVSAVVVDFITPETETSMWYFWGMARQFQPGDAALTDLIRAAQATVFAEDLEMLERQQANLTHWPERRLLNLNTDAGGVMARKHLDRLLEAERSTGTGATQPQAA
jgi:vanillate O-demethylase monooxygenase subunit